MFLKNLIQGQYKKLQGSIFSDKAKEPLNVKDLFKRLPFLSKNMKDHEKKEIEQYMAEKVIMIHIKSTTRFFLVI